MDTIASNPNPDRWSTTAWKRALRFRLSHPKSPAHTDIGIAARDVVADRKLEKTMASLQELINQTPA